MNYSILNKKSTFNKEYDWGMLRLNMCEKVIDKKIYVHNFHEHVKQCKSTAFNSISIKCEHGNMYSCESIIKTI